MVNFDYDDSRIRSDMEPILRQKVEILRSSPNVRLRLEGHTDERGSGEYNLALGSRRAQSVLHFFRRQPGSPRTASRPPRTARSVPW
jgi:peptidoglycan-associated lipoprotein